MITYNGYYILWNLIVASQGSNTLPIGTILPYVGDLSKLPHGWFLCDGTNGTPDLRDRFLQGSNTAGTFIEAGLPNIVGSFSADQYDPRALRYGGAFYPSHYFEAGDAGTGSNDVVLFNFDASRCSYIYGRSTTVQPASYTVFYIMRIM